MARGSNLCETYAEKYQGNYILIYLKHDREIASPPPTLHPSALPRNRRNTSATLDKEERRRKKEELLQSLEEGRRIRKGAELVRLANLKVFEMAQNGFTWRVRALLQVKAWTMGQRVRYLLFTVSLRIGTTTLPQQPTETWCGRGTPHAAARGKGYRARRAYGDGTRLRTEPEYSLLRICHELNHV